VTECIIKIPCMSLMYPSYHQKFCISVQVLDASGVVPCTVCEKEAEFACSGYCTACYCSEECQV